MVTLPDCCLDGITGVIVDCFGLFQDHIICDRRRLSVRRFIKVVPFVAHNRSTEAVERGLREFLRT